MKRTRREDFGLPARLLEEGWLPPRAAAAALGIEVDELQERVREGGLRVRRFNGLVLVEVTRRSR